MNDIELWRRASASEAPTDDAARLLALAAVADGTADDDERQLVAEWLAQHPDIADDIAAAARIGDSEPEPAPEQILRRAAALVPASADIVPFRPGRHSARGVGGWTGWGSLVAAMAVASWLGFTLGVDTTRDWLEVRQSDESFLREMLDPSAGLMRDLSDGSQT